MKLFLVSIFLSVCCQNVYAHSVERYIKEKEGITLIAFITRRSVEERKIQDAFLHRLVQKLRRKDKNIPIFLITDHFNLPFHRREWFASVSYDTLRIPDHEFLKNYLYYRMGPSYREHVSSYIKPLSEKHKIDLPEPIDLGSSYDESHAPVGLKIMYQYGVNDSSTGWDRLYTMVQYAIDNIDEIKSKQNKIVLRYPVPYMDSTSYKPRVSLLTIDTSIIKKIPLQNFGFDHRNLPKEKNVLKYIMFGVIFIILLLIIAFLRRRPNTANII